MSSNNRKKQEIITSIEENVDTPIESIAMKARVVNCEKVNFRAEPNGEKLAILDAGTEVTIHEEEGIWSYVSVAGKFGYIMSEYLGV